MCKIYHFAMLGILMTVMALVGVPFLAQATDIAPLMHYSPAITADIECNTIPNFDARAEYCILNNPIDATVRIEIIRSKDTGIIQHTNLIGQAKQVTLGDLVATLGQPEIQWHGNQINLLWSNVGVAASAFSSTAQVSNSLPIWRIAFAPHTSHAPA